jgi:hypothetical protein
MKIQTIKKQISILIVLVMMIGILTGCGELTSVKKMEAKTSGTHSIEVTWDKVKKADSYEVAITKINPDTENTDDVKSDKKSNSDSAKIDKAAAKGNKDDLIAKTVKTEKAKFDKLAAGTEYEVTVVSTKKSDKSVEKSAPIRTVVKTEAIKVPAPKQITATAVDTAQILVTWGKVELPKTEKGEVSYIVESSADSTGKDMKSSEKVKELEFTDTELAEATERFYVVHTIFTIDGVDYESEPSEDVNATTKFMLNGSASNDSTIDLSWIAIAGASKIELWEGETGVTGDIALDATTYQVGGLAENSEHTYTVRALFFDKDGNVIKTVESVPVAVTTPAKPAVPALVANGTKSSSNIGGGSVPAASSSSGVPDAQAPTSAPAPAPAPEKPKHEYYVVCICGQEFHGDNPTQQWQAHSKYYEDLLDKAALSGVGIAEAGAEYNKHAGYKGYDGSIEFR